MFHSLSLVPTLEVRRLDLWWSAEHYECRENRGIAQVHDLLRLAANRFSESISVHDASEFGSEDSNRLYRDELMVTAVAWDYRLRNIFGSRKSPGSSAGRFVPAVVVRFRGDFAPLCAPHEQWTRIDGHTTYQLHTALDAIGMLHPDEQKRLFGRHI